MEEKDLILSTSVACKNIDPQLLMKQNVKIFGKIKRKRQKKTRIYKKKLKQYQKVKIDRTVSITFL